ncbi:MAG TPA: hypothetical protein ENL34_04125 [Chloroflexi bacterium]|nr:hypothetical protein [Chloroflexota bacterium]
MRSSLIGKIDKARRYAKEPGRVTLRAITADFHGENADHHVSYADGKWNCTCAFFGQWQTCSHVMALQEMYRPELPPEALESFPEE